MAGTKLYCLVNRGTLVCEQLAQIYRTKKRKETKTEKLLSTPDSVMSGVEVEFLVVRNCGKVGFASSQSVKTHGTLTDWW